MADIVCVTVLIGMIDDIHVSDSSGAKPIPHLWETGQACARDGGRDRDYHKKQAHRRPEKISRPDHRADRLSRPLGQPRSRTRVPLELHGPIDGREVAGKEEIGAVRTQ